MWNPKLYDDKHSFVWKHGASLVELLAPKPGERILDLGCGTGHLTAQIAAAGAEVVGIDLNSGMIDQARNAYPQLRFEIADAEDFVFDEQFDAVFSNAVLHWIRHPEKVVASVYRALKPGGRFVVEFGGKGNIREIMRALGEAYGQTTGGDLEPKWYYPSIGEYATLLEQGRLEVTFATLFDRPTPLDGEEGLRHWVEMFRGDLLNSLTSAKREEFLQHMETKLRPVLYYDGTWHADYRRLRIVANRG